MDRLKAKWAAMPNPLKIVLVAIVLVIFASMTFGQSSRCANRDVVTSALAERYGETRLSLGVIGDRAFMETFANLETGTWTILVSTADGMSCMLASGEAFEFVSESAEPAGMRL